MRSYVVVETTETPSRVVTLDLAAHWMKRRLLAEVAAFNELGVAPTIAEVVRKVGRDRRASQYRATRWYANMHALSEAGYLTLRPTARGYMLSVTDLGRVALDETA